MTIIMQGKRCLSHPLPERLITDGESDIMGASRNMTSELRRMYIIVFDYCKEMHGRS